MCFSVKWRRNTPYKRLLLDHPYTWRLEGTERSDVVQETEENVINYKQSTGEIQHAERTPWDWGKINFRWLSAFDFFQERAWSGCKGC